MVLIAIPMQPGHHLCLFYHDASPLWPFVASFFREGLERNEQGLYVAEEHGLEEILTSLEAHGLASSVLCHRGRLMIRRADECGLTTCPFSADQAVAAWQAAADAARSSGFRGLRLVIDMSWVLRNPASLAQLAEYEAKTHRLLSAEGSAITLICQYNPHRFPEEILLDVLHTHPLISLEGVVYDNLFHLPPDIFLRQDRKAQFHWCLNRLTRNHFQAEAALADPPPESATKSSPWEAASRLRPPARASTEAATAVARSVPSQQNADEAFREWRWQIQCLGELSVRRHDGTLVNWDMAKAATKKVKTLFAYLLERGRAGAPLEQLADLLWPNEGDAEKALGRLYHTLHALRLGLEPDLTNGRASRHVIIREGRCFLHLPDQTWIDAVAFEQFCYRGERLLEAGDDENAQACYLAADKLYAGDLLADIPMAYAERTDDDWCWSRRYWLQEMYLKLQVGLAGICRRRGALQEALGYARSALAVAPCDEAAHREVMHIFSQAGRSDALDRQYHLCQELLRRHEDRPPDIATTSLYAELTRGNGRRSKSQRKTKALSATLQSA